MTIAAFANGPGRRTLRRFHISTSVIAPLLAMASSGCSNPLEFFTGDPDLPQDNGVAWQCVGTVQMYGITGFPNKDAKVAVCANPGTSQSDLIEECEEECGQ